MVSRHATGFSGVSDENELLDKYCLWISINNNIYFAKVRHIRNKKAKNSEAGCQKAYTHQCWPFIILTKLVDWISAKGVCNTVQQSKIIMMTIDQRISTVTMAMHTHPLNTPDAATCMSIAYTKLRLASSRAAWYSLGYWLFEAYPSHFPVAADCSRNCLVACMSITHHSTFVIHVHALKTIIPKVWVARYDSRLKSRVISRTTLPIFKNM